MSRAVFLLASLTVLAGCGGDNGTSQPVAVVNGPSTPAPSPSPAPTPANPMVSGEIRLSNGDVVISASMDLAITGELRERGGTIVGGATSNRSTAIGTTQFLLQYNNQTGYRLTDGINDVRFGNDSLASDTTSTNGRGTVLFVKNSGSVRDYLAFYQKNTYTQSSIGSGYSVPRYGQTAGWQHTVDGTTSKQTRLNYFAYGSPTPIASMPRSGRVRFTALSTGNYATNSDLWFIDTYEVRFVVDFAAGLVEGRIAVAGESLLQNTVGGIGYIPIEGRIEGNAVSGSFPYGVLGADGGVPGEFQLRFVGPSADEIIVTFVAANGEQSLVGSAVGIVDRYSTFAP